MLHQTFRKKIKALSEHKEPRSRTENAISSSYLISSSVTMKALQRGWEVFSQTPGFFSTAAESCPVMGMVLVCRALAMAESRVSSVQPGPTPARGREIHNQHCSRQGAGNQDNEN